MLRTAFNLADHLRPQPNRIARPTERLKAINRRTILSQDDVLKAIGALKKSVIKMVWMETHDMDLFKRLDQPDITEQYRIIPLPQIILDNCMHLCVLTTEAHLDRTLKRIQYRLSQESTIL